MTAEEAIALIRLIRVNRKWDDQGEFWYVDADELEETILESVEGPAA